jgi:hypothetical protein
METIACTLNQEDLGSRRERWLVLGSRALIAVETTSGGLELVFAREPGVEDELARLAELERDCCPFATWEVASGDGRVVMDVAGKTADAIPAVQGMFGPLCELLATRGQ